MFAQFLTQRIQNSIKFEQSLDFIDFHEKLNSGGLIYANPQDSLKLIKTNGYIPIARPVNLFDEIVFLTSNNIKNPTLQDFAGSTVISVTSMMVTQVGINYLERQHIKPLEVLSRSSWMTVVRHIYRGENDFGLVYKDFYDGLTNLSKRNLQKVGETQDASIHHNFLIAPELQTMTDTIKHYLLNMKDDSPQGEEILNNLGIQKLVSVSKNDILHPWDSAKHTIDVMANKLAHPPSLCHHHHPTDNIKNNSPCSDVILNHKNL
ncbi:MAG: PhnD/SsuA/transferrin family substrate-binding protein [Cocleimonas sp.]|nr:PhnD/SsuA/transferrin family substrate-binding protein [Cocleimonas sp.]